MLGRPNQVPQITIDHSGNILRRIELETLTEYQPLSLTEQAVNAMKQFEPMIATVREHATLTVAADGFDKVKQTRQQMKRLRLDIEAKRKELKAGALEYGRTVDSIAKELAAPVVEVEGILQAQEDIVEAEKEKIRQEKAAAKAAAVQVRVDALQAAGCAADMDAVNSLSDDDFQWHLSIESKKAAEARAEHERLEALRFEEIKRQDEEIRIRHEEMQAERMKIEAERSAMLAEQAELRRLKDEHQAEIHARAEAERQKVLAERRAEDDRAEQIRKNELEAARLARLEALKPEIDKAETFGKALMKEAQRVLLAMNQPHWGQEAEESVRRCALDVLRIARGE